MSLEGSHIRVVYRIADQPCVGEILHEIESGGLSIKDRYYILSVSKGCAVAFRVVGAVPSVNHDPLTASDMEIEDASVARVPDSMFLCDTSSRFVFHRSPATGHWLRQRGGVLMRGEILAVGC